MKRLDAATSWSLGLWLVFGLLPVLIAPIKWKPLLADQGLAAWIQAVGSIAAILAAGGLLLVQHHLDRRRADEELAAQRGRAALAIYQLTSAILGKSVDFVDNLMRPERSALFYVMFRSEVASFERIFAAQDLSLLAGYKELSAVSAVATTLHALQHCVGEMVSNRPAFLDSPDLRDLLELMPSTLVDLEKELYELAKRLNPGSELHEPHSPMRGWQRRVPSDLCENEARALGGL